MILEGACPSGFYWVTRAMCHKTSVVFILILLGGAWKRNEAREDSEAFLPRLLSE